MGAFGFWIFSPVPRHHLLPVARILVCPVVQELLRQPLLGAAYKC